MSWTCAQALVERIRAGVPFLGICLGLQALFEASEEAPEARGLGFSGRGAALSRRRARAAHGLERAGSRAAIRSCCATCPARPFVYFAHSYYVPENARAAATCTYEAALHGGAGSGNVFGVQFHPEKSGPVGLRIVRNFLEM